MHFSYNAYKSQVFISTVGNFHTSLKRKGRFMLEIVLKKKMPTWNALKGLSVGLLLFQNTFTVLK